MKKGLPAQVRIVEVGPRDGLQNESVALDTAIKVELIEALAGVGLTRIESGAFVSPNWVPRMADSAEVMRRIRRSPGVSYPVLVPNLVGLDAALACGCEEIAVFAAATEQFSRRNINCSVAESIQRFVPVVERALAAGLRVRGYVSCVLGCPYEGRVAPQAVAGIAAELAALGCYEVSLGDTLGVGVPLDTARLFEAVSARVPVERLAGHFHDTYGMAIANIHVAMQCGVNVFDSAVAGLGGCPYAPGASGNVATEDLVYLLQGCGVECGVDLDALVGVSAWISRCLGRTPTSHLARARACADAQGHV